MKSPDELARRLARQWNNADLRQARLLRADAWPVSLPIGKPTADDAGNRPGAIRDHIGAWQRVRAGRVVWQSVRYRGLAEAISVPVQWELDKPSEWIDATGDSKLRREFEDLAHIIGHIDALFHTFAIRQRHLLSRLDADEFIAAANLAMTIEPGMAGGRPLRALALPGIDTKFFERNARLLTRLLDIRFDGSASDMGLENFMDAAPQSEQWLLVVDLDGTLLPFRQMRLRDSELERSPLPGSRLLIVENERCSHVLPRVPDCLAVLGAGLNLAWMAATWLADKRLAYWGDIDTWGLTMLARAREKQPGVTPLLMTRAVFDGFCADHAVTEPVPAANDAPSPLSAAEVELYRSLRQTMRGRLEQEFIPAHTVQAAVLTWAEAS